MDDADEEQRYFSDDDVERLFGVSASKLRTAQRFGLVESFSELQHGRYVRVWDDVAATRAYAASLLSEHMAIPYNVACQISVAYVNFFDNLDELVERFKRREPFTSFKSDPTYPLLALVDRTCVLLLHQGSDIPIGLVERAEDGRMEFRADNTMTAPNKQDALSLTVYDPRVVMDRFMEIAGA